jgi:Ca2+-binding RTX toxin-like protein
MSFTATVSVSTLDGGNGFTITGSDGQATGHSVASAGDVNGDGFDDLIVGSFYSYYSGEPRAGASYVVFGSGAPFAGEIDLDALDGSNGFRLTQADAYAGTSVASAGDINGDGYADLIVGSGGFDDEGVHSPGDSYVVFGRAGGFAADFDLAGLNGANGFRLDGLDGGFKDSSASVSSAGDINGDGLDDMLVAVTGGENYDSGGAAYIVFGSTAPFGASLELGLLDGTRGFQIHNLTGGASVAEAGDVNGDGIGDFTVGDAQANGSTGQAHVVFGRNGGFGGSLDLATLDGSNGYTLNGAAEGDLAGNAVASAGDVNGDGIDDLIIGAHGVDGLSGAAYVVFGTAGGGAADIDLGSLNGSNGFRIAGLGASMLLGASVSAAGDVNGDGYDDVIVAAPGTGGTGGEAYVVFGGRDPFSSSLDVGNLDGGNGFRIDGLSSGEEGGLAVAAAGDVNGDLLDDLIVGAEAAADGAGESYVLFGRIPTSEVIRFGSDADQTIHGSDIVGGEDYLYGEGGDDIIVSYRGLDHARGGAGSDILFVDYSQQGAVHFETRSVSVEGSFPIITHHVVAQAGAGGPSSNVEYDAFERFFIIGSATAGNQLRGGSGGDYLVGGAGSDVIKTFGEPDLEPSSANSGDDIVDIGKGGATAATTGSDVVEMGTGGDDQLIVDWSAATVAVAFTAQFGFGGADYASRTDFMPITIGGDARLSFNGVERFTLATGSGDDVIRTGANADEIRSGAGDDRIDSAAGRGTIDGGAGTDRWTADLSARTDAIILNLNQPGVRSLADGTTVTGVEGLGLEGVAFTTGAGNDVIETSSSGTVADLIATGSGNDVVELYGAATGLATGLDTVTMGANGNDQLIVDYSAAIEAVAFTAQFGSGGVDYSSRPDFMPVTIGGTTVLHFAGVERFVVRTGSGADTILTGANADLVSSGAGNDSINSGAGKAVIDGGTGTDLWAGDLSAPGVAIVLDLNLAGIQNLADGSSVVRIEGFGPAGLVTGAAGDIITTRASGTVADKISTGGGNDSVTLFGAATGLATKLDTITMGDGGDDHLTVDYSAATEAVAFTAQFGSGGVDYSSRPDFMPITIGGTTVLHFAGVERFTVRTGSGGDTILTGANADAVSSGAGDDLINSGAGKATIDGGTGIDLWAGDLSAPGVAIVLDLNLAGIQNLADGSSVVRIEGFGPAGLVTGAGKDAITTKASGTVADKISTGAGDDMVTLFGAATGAVTGLDTIAMGDGGNDHLAVDYSTATEAVAFTAQFGSGGADYSSRPDFMPITIGGNIVLHFNGVERFTITTGAGADAIATGANADTIDGGAGADRMTGGDGSDTYHVDDAGDVVVEGLTGDEDRVLASASYALGADAEVEILETANAAGTAAIALTGNRFVNILTGNRGANALDGGGAADRMTGGDGSDTYRVDEATDRVFEGLTGDQDRVIASVSYRLAAGQQIERLQTADALGTQAIGLTGNEFANIITGNEGANVLNGADGGDDLTGGGGNDVYYLDDLADQVHELAGGGVDEVRSTVDHVLGADVENLRLSGPARAGTGNALDNRITGSTGADTLSGLAGDDSLSGGNDDDTLLGGSGADVLFGASGADLLDGGDGDDILSGEAGTDRLNGGIGNDRLDGGDAADILDGGEGADTLLGRQGRDAMTGGTGADIFVFGTGDSSATRSQADAVSDFSKADGDKIHLRGIDAVEATAADEAFAFIGTGAFTGTAGQLRFETVAGATLVQGDTDGDKIADFFIRLDGAVPLAAGDFVL